MTQDLDNKTEVDEATDRGATNLAETETIVEVEPIEDAPSEEFFGQTVPRAHSSLIEPEPEQSAPSACAPATLAAEPDKAPAVNRLLLTQLVRTTPRQPQR